MPDPSGNAAGYVPRGGEERRGPATDDRSAHRLIVNDTCSARIAISDKRRHPLCGPRPVLLDCDESAAGGGRQHQRGVDVQAGWRLVEIDIDRIQVSAMDLVDRHVVEGLALGGS